jgi:hypothetical protein
MNAVRGIVRDLVDRRLWPVALLLVAAVVAVPVYLGKSSSNDAGSAPIASAPTTDKASKAAVTLEDTPADGAGRGSVRNPFTQLHVPKATTPTPSTTSASKTADKTAAGSGGSSGGTAPTGSGSGGSTDNTSPSDSNKDPLDVYHLTLRFGKAGNLKTIKDVARLSPLPSADNPFFVFTGVLKDGKTAVFLLSSDADATGDGHCKPSPQSCQTIEVKQGDTEFFDLKVGGQDVQYQLDVLSVYPKGASSSTAVAAAAERHSKAGAAMLRDAHVKGRSAFRGASGYRWLPDRGVLVRAPQHSKAHASANGAAAASSADVEATLPGVPVWHTQPGA